MSGDDDHKLLARVDERTVHIMVTLKQLSDLVASHYVTKEEFSPVRSIAYGILGFVGIAVLTAVVKLVIR
jgi:hypothetical protein